MGVLSACLATGAAGSLALFPVLIMMESLGTDGLIGWGIGVLCAAIVAGMTPRPLWHQARIVVIGIGCVGVPIALIALGMGSIGAVGLGVGLISCAFVMPLVEWACGLSETGGNTKGSLLQFSSGRDAPNPIPSTLVLGVLIFAWPGDLLTAGWVAAPFFGCLLMLASLGGMFSRVRESSSGLVGVHPKFMGQWFLTGIIATILCAAVGFLLPLSMGNVYGMAERKLGGPVSGGPYATQIRDVQNSQPKPDYSQSNPNGLGDKQFDKDLPKPNQIQPKKMTPEEMQAKLITLGVLIAVAILLLYLLKRYNKQVVAMLRKLWDLISGPFVRVWTNFKEKRRRKKHEAAVQAILASIEDPYADPPESLTTEDLGPLYDKLVADLALVGAKPREEESVQAFVRRVATVYSVDRESLYYLGAVMTEATFSQHALPEPKLSGARDRFLKIRKQVHNSVAPQMLPERQAAYRWSAAEARLKSDE